MRLIVASGIGLKERGGGRGLGCVTGTDGVGTASVGSKYSQVSLPYPKRLTNTPLESVSIQPLHGTTARAPASMKFPFLRSLPKARRPAAAAVTGARAASSVSQRPNSDHVSFPDALKSAFTSSLRFETPASYSALPTYRVVDQHGEVVDPSFRADIVDDVVKLYKNMLYISIMDLIMFDVQRQGRLSFYMVSAGEEAVSVGSASVLDPEDPVYCQYREQGFFKQRGFTTKEFMSQLFANKNDSGKGRNMPIHYGSRRLHIVSVVAPCVSAACG